MTTTPWNNHANENHVRCSNGVIYIHQTLWIRANKGSWRRGTMLPLQELFRNMGLLDRSTQNYWIGNRILRASLCCSYDPSLLDKIWFSRAEWVQTALIPGHKLIISKWKVLSALAVNVWHSQLGTIEASNSLSFCLMTGVESCFCTKGRSFISGNQIKWRQVEWETRAAIGRDCSYRKYSSSQS